MKIRIEDKLFSQYIRMRAVDRMKGCEYCGRACGWQDLDCSHFHSRRHKSTRFDPDNASGLCGGCHMHLDESHDDFTEWFKKRLGTDRYELLRIRKNTIKKFTKAEIEALKENLKEKINILKEGVDD